MKTAQRALTMIIALLIVLLAGIAYRARVYHIGATEPGRPGYESVLSQLTAAVAGRNAFYYITIAAILLTLAFSANTAFADFPRLCRAVAQDGYLPIPFATRGRRLVYSQGIMVLAVLCGILLIIFGGVTDRLIPLFAVGAFLAFTLSQSGMVAHWKKRGGKKARHSIIINGVGAIATATPVLVVTFTKFVEGAWVTTLLIPAIIIFMLAVRRHYDRVGREIANPKALDLKGIQPPLVVMPILGWNKVTEKGLRFALELSPDVHVLHIAAGEESDELRKNWSRYVEKPAAEAGLQQPRLVVLQSPYRFVINPIVDYVLDLGKKNADRKIAVVIPELVESHWYQYFLISCITSAANG